MNKATTRMADKTSEQYQKALDACKDIFFDKMRHYGTPWRILLSKAFTDQIFIKSIPIPFIQEFKTSKVGEGIQPEIIGTVNHGSMALFALMHIDENDSKNNQN